ncbi:hypothetical protein HAX54_010081 [Datura stramonium]|uniref:Uncharacterized protein n=1 Tax=Datura stramonium TaxID=4076 RepID=A0ABS8RX93_DATST|nr:hypothetical protein [Datura stramonium]
MEGCNDSLRPVTTHGDDPLEETQRRCKDDPLTMSHRMTRGSRTSRVPLQGLQDSSTSGEFLQARRSNKHSGSGASSISSGIRLENVSKSYKGVMVLKDEEFMSAFKEEMEVAERLEKLQKAIEKSIDD